MLRPLGQAAAAVPIPHALPAKTAAEVALPAEVVRTLDTQGTQVR
eukprot:COSAG03_NODE_9340_length_728_cov_0.737679_1_plen_45_part_00